MTRVINSSSRAEPVSPVLFTKRFSNHSVGRRFVTWFLLTLFLTAELNMKHSAHRLAGGGNVNKDRKENCSAGRSSRPWPGMTRRCHFRRLSLHRLDEHQCTRKQHFYRLFIRHSSCKRQVYINALVIKILTRCYSNSSFMWTKLNNDWKYI